MKRNAWVELYRFLFTVSVFLFHLFSYFEIQPEMYHGGFLSVEFFFLVSGCFLAKSVRSHMEQASFSDAATYVGTYVRSRLLRLYPLYFIALCLALVAKKISFDPSFIGIRRWLFENYAEFLMLQWTPLGKEVLLSPLWFVPALFFAGLLLTAIAVLFRTHLRLYGLVLCPVCFLGIYGYYFVTIGKIDVIFSYHCLLRGLAGVSLGWFLFELLNALHAFDTNEKKKGKKLPFFLLSNLVLIAILIYENFAHRDRFNFLVIAGFAVGFAFLLIGSVEPSEKKAKLLCLLGSLTYPIYVFHMPLFHLIRA
nr:acyltransferase family protein [Lachnospiraceae bacterium]